MTDIVDRATRSRMMSGIRGRDTRPEMLVRRRLHRLGFRFRLHVRGMPGKPDLVLARYHAVIFVNGCFWHGHNCPFFRVPGTRKDFWSDKIAGNKANDRKVRKLLLAAGWRVGVVWECALRGAGEDQDKVGRRLASWLRSNRNAVEVRG